MKTGNLVLIAALTGWNSFPAPWAQGAEQAPEEKKKAGSVPTGLPEMVVSASRGAQTLLQAPVVVRTLNAEQLTQRQVRSLPEALREVPGVNVQKTANGQGSPFVRGFTGFRNLALIDGVRLNNSIMRDGPNQYWATVDPLALSRLELVVGQGGVLYGSDSIGGTLNLITKDSGFDREAEGWFFHGQSSWRGASAENSHVWRQEMQLGQGGRWGLHLGASLKSFGDVHAAGVGTQPYTGYDEWAYDTRLDVALDPNWKLTAVHQQMRQDDVWRTHATVQGRPFQGTVVGSDLQRSYDQQRSLSYVKLAATDLRGMVDEFSLTVSYQGVMENETRVRKPSENRGNFSQTHVSTLGFDLQASSQSPLGRLTYGADYFRDWVASASQRYNLAGRFLRDEIQGPVGDDASYHLLGLYLLDQIDFSEDLHLHLGERFTYAAADVGRFDDPSTASGVDGNNDSWHRFSGQARVVYDLDERDEHSLYGGVAQGFRAPNLSDLSRLDIARSGEKELPSAGLAPERFLQFEAGIKRNKGRLSGQLGYFYTRISDMIIRRRTGEMDGSNAVVEKSNDGDGYIHGVELAGDLKLEAGWSLFGHVTWSEGRVDQFQGTSRRLAAEPASRVVPLMWRGGVRWQSDNQRLWTELVAFGQSDYDRLSSGDRLDNQRIPPGGNPGFTWLTLRGGVQLSQNLEITAALENALNQEVRYAGSGSNEPGIGGVLGVAVKW